MKQEKNAPSFKALQDWVTLHLPLALKQAHVDIGEINWQPINGDAGFRQYYRLTGDGFSGCYLAVLSPPATENNDAFVDMANFFNRHHVRVPTVFSCSKAEGFLLIEDLGDNLLHPNLNEESVNGLYGQVLTSLLHMQTLPLDAIFPPYNAEVLNREMALFPEWFISKLLGHTVTENEKALIDQAFSLLTQSALSQPQVIVHRDFHSRNILLDSTHLPSFIDFQDGVVGPITYDLVSLLKDCYIEWPEQQVEQWAIAYGNLLIEAGMMPAVSAEQFLRWFHLMGLQRHIKVLGIFARLHLRDNKPSYLNDLPLVIEYVRRVLARYPEFSAINEWFESVIMPLAELQPWMQSREK